MKSIIETIETDMRMQYENGVLKAVKNIGFNVDKERLTQALVDSRSFYNEGYNDAKNEYKREWINVKDRLPEEGQYIVTTKFGIKISSFSNNLYKLDKYDFADYKGKQRKGFYNYDSEYGYFEQDVIAWMPLPKPYGI